MIKEITSCGQLEYRFSLYSFFVIELYSTLATWFCRTSYKSRRDIFFHLIVVRLAPVLQLQERFYLLLPIDTHHFNFPVPFSKASLQLFFSSFLTLLYMYMCVLLCIWSFRAIHKHEIISSNLKKMHTFSWPSYFDHFFGTKYYPLHQNPSKEWCVFTVYNSSTFSSLQYNEIFSRSPKRSIVAKLNCQFSYFILFNFHNIWIIIIPGYHLFTWPDVTHSWFSFYLTLFFLLSLLCWFLLFSLIWNILILEQLRDQW